MHEFHSPHLIFYTYLLFSALLSPFFPISLLSLSNSLNFSLSHMRLSIHRHVNSAVSLSLSLSFFLSLSLSLCGPVKCIASGGPLRRTTVTQQVFPSGGHTMAGQISPGSSHIPPLPECSFFYLAFVKTLSNSSAVNALELTL